MNERSRPDFLRLLRRSNPRQRSTTMQTIEGRVSEDGIGFVREELSCIEEDMTVRKVSLFTSRLCDCNRLIGAKNTLKGRCNHPGCANFVCSECMHVCCRCGRVCCPRHVTVYADGEIYCNRCRTTKWIKMFFDIGNEGKEK